MRIRWDDLAPTGMPAGMTGERAKILAWLADAFHWLYLDTVQTQDGPLIAATERLVRDVNGLTVNSLGGDVLGLAEAYLRFYGNLSRRPRPGVPLSTMVHSAPYIGAAVPMLDA